MGEGSNEYWREDNNGHYRVPLFIKNSFMDNESRFYSDKIPLLGPGSMSFKMEFTMIYSFKRLNT